MAVGAITPYGTSGVNATYFTTVKRLSQPLGITQISASKAYEVALTTAAKVKALELQGYTVSMIALKLGLDIKTINQFLGVTVTASNATAKTMYTPPKKINTTLPSLPTYTEPTSTYVEPKTFYTEPQALTKATTELTSDLTKLTTVQYAATQLISTAKNETAVKIISEALAQGGELVNSS